MSSINIGLGEHSSEGMRGEGQDRLVNSNERGKHGC